MNMSYCRFENTAKAMRDCLNAIEDGDLYDFSKWELNGFKNFFELAKVIVEREYEFEMIVEWYENESK